MLTQIITIYIKKHNTMINETHPLLLRFLMDIAQGVFGENTLTHTEIATYQVRITTVGVEKLEGFYWAITKASDENEDLCVELVNELVNEIYSIIN